MTTSPTPQRRREPGNLWTGFLLGGVLLLIMAVLAVSTTQRVKRGEELMRQSLTHQALLLVEYLEGASRANMRRGMWRVQILQALVEETAQHPPIRLLAILGPAEETLAVGRNQEIIQGGPLEGLPEEIKREVDRRAEFIRFEPKELVVGRPFDPLRRFRLTGKTLPSWACPVDENQPGLGPPPPPGPGEPPPEAWGRGPGRGPGPGPRQGPRRGMGMPMEHQLESPAFRGYALVRLSTQAFSQARAQALHEALLLAALIFLAAGLAAGGLWAAGRRRDNEINRLRREVAETEHLAALGRLAGSVAHEVRNPLSAVRGLVQYLAKGEEPGSKKAEYAAAAVEEVDRLERVVSGLLDYTRPREPRRVPLDLEESLRGVMNLMSDDPRASGVELKLSVEPGLAQVSADPDQIRQVLVNLMLNALEALNGRGHLFISARTLGDGVEVEIGDDGPGLPAGDPEQVFDPFFSTRERGTGLGLAIARRIMRAHGGDLKAGGSPEGGALFVMTLPGGGGRP